MESGLAGAGIAVVRGDITTIKADAIVNAANSGLMGGGGVDGAIHRAGGPAIQEACREVVARQRRCPSGEAVITTAGNLPAMFVIHTVGPVWSGGLNHEPELLAACYRNSLHLAVDNNCRSIAFPNISTGVYGYPKNLAAEVAVNTVREVLNKPGIHIKVLFVCFDEENYQIISKKLERRP